MTFNLKDFLAEAMRARGLEVVHPDTFLVSLAGSDPIRFMEIVAEMVKALRNPPTTVLGAIDALRRGGVGQTADWIAGEIAEGVGLLSRE